eukprot:4914097-Alexandrium_andersonii.AAC.1
MSLESRNFMAAPHEHGHGSAYTAARMWMVTPSRFLERLSASANRWMKLSLFFGRKGTPMMMAYSVRKKSSAST